MAGIIPLFELDAYAVPVVMMAAVPGDELDPSVEAKYRKALVSGRLKEGIVAALRGDSRRRSVPGDDRRVFRQDDELRERSHQRRHVAAREVGAPDRAREERVAR